MNAFHAVGSIQHAKCMDLACGCCMGKMAYFDGVIGNRIAWVFGNPISAGVRTREEILSVKGNRECMKLDEVLTKVIAVTTGIAIFIFIVKLQN